MVRVEGTDMQRPCGGTHLSVERLMENLAGTERKVDGKSRPRSHGISHSEGSIWLRLIAFKTFSLGLSNLTSRENSIMS